MQRFITLVFFLLLGYLSFAQRGEFIGIEIQNPDHPALDIQFKKYNVYEIDIPAIHEYVSRGDQEYYLKFHFGSEFHWRMQIFPHDIRGPEYKIVVQTDKGQITLPAGENTTYRGYMSERDGGVVGLTINDHHFAGTVQLGDGLYFIEPLRNFDKNAPESRVVIYAESDVIPNENVSCGADEMHRRTRHLEKSHNHGNDDDGGGRMLACYEVDLAIADDYLMYLDYGQNVQNVIDHNLTVMNNVGTNWDNEFVHELQFKVVTHFVSTCNNCDPWTNSTDAGALLSSFRSWGNSGGFGTSYDLAQLWTDRNLSGSTVGIAYIDGVCTSWRYHVLQDYTSNSNSLRTLTSHEIGHNFDADHDAPGAPFIMAPSVNGSNSWSNASQNAINATINQRINSCFSACTVDFPPIADFSGDNTSGCVPLTVNFTDLSQNSPTVWQWTFSGGTPSSSTQQNPTVTYNAAGDYSVTLTVTNSAGTSSITKPFYINAIDEPEIDFDADIMDNFVIFTNNTLNGDSWLWDFGDGNTSTNYSPTHTYEEDGTYVVTLQASNICGTTTHSEVITILTLPQANFTSNVQEGCAPLVVNFIDQSSSNTDFWLWTMPGASPEASTEQNPVVVYNQPGIYDVTLEVINGAGSHSITHTEFILVHPAPIAVFTSSVNGLTVTFDNNSENADSYSWDFGDGNTSDEENPTHTYAQGGDYTVVLTATSDECGDVTLSQEISINGAPVAGFTSDTQEGCAALTVEFSDNSLPDPDSWSWTFEGGTPSSSTEENPTVTYNNPGTFDVTLIVSNDAGQDTITLTDYITVTTVPNASFTSEEDGLDVDFTNTSTNADSYDWDFGDGNTSDEENPSHTYATDGEYVVELTATNDCGSVTVSQTVTIVTAPVAGFSANITSGCAPLTVQFTDESSENTTSWSWTFEGGTPANSTDQNPTVTYNNPGVFDVILEVSNAAGQSTATQLNYVVVTTVPNAGFTSEEDGLDVDFTNTSTNADSYDWDFGDGNTSDEEHPGHTYATDGEYVVELTATNDCGSVTVSQTITIVSAPVAGFSANNTSGCAPLTVQFTDESSENATAWSWTFEGGTPATSNDQNPTVTFNNPGSYDVTLTASNAAGQSTVTQTNYVVVTTIPVAGYTSEVDGFTVDFTNNSNNATSYHWDFGDGEESTETDPSHEYQSDGEYTVVLTATNDCGSQTFTETITIVTAPLAGFSAEVSSGCAPFTVQFMDESSGNTTSWEWSFPGGNPGSSEEQNPEVVYETPGIYDVTLIASNDAGSDTYTQLEIIIVNDQPTADFSSTLNGTTINFQNNSTGATEYLWDFGDGNDSDEENPSHTYDETGEYTVTLTAMNDCGSETIEYVINIADVPQAAFTADVTLGCHPLTVQFTDNSVNAESWLWSFPGGTPNTSIEQNPEVTYNSPGNYSVTLEATNASGTGTVTMVSYITVENIPQPSFTSSLTGLVGIFTNTSNGGTSFEWDFGDGGSSNQENPTYIYAQDGQYTVTLTVTNSCGSVATSQNITVATPPTANFNAEETTGCAPLTVQFNSQSSPNTVNWSWSFPGGTPNSSTEQNPMVVYDAPGVYDVTLTVSNPAGSDEEVALGYIEVNGLPEADFDSAVNGITVNFTNNSTNGNSYEWDFGDGNSSSNTNPQHQYEDVGDYDVQLIVTNECGADTIMQTVTIQGFAPEVAFTADERSGCLPMTVQFSDASSQDPDSWFWTFEGGTPATSDEQHPVVVYETAGTYEVSLTAYNVFGENTFTEIDYIVVSDVPVAAFDYDDENGTVTFENNSSGGNTYEWDFGDGSPVSNEESPVHNYDATGEYKVILTVTNECGSVTIERVVQVTVSSVEDFENINTFNVFPNPNNGSFTLILEGFGVADLKLEVFNVLGQSIFSEMIEFNGSFSKEFNLINAAAGAYIVQLRSDEHSMYKKIIVER